MEERGCCVMLLRPNGDGGDVVVLVVVDTDGVVVGSTTAETLVEDDLKKDLMTIYCVCVCDVFLFYQNS